MEAKNLYPTIPEYGNMRIDNIMYDEEHNIIRIEQISGNYMGMYPCVRNEKKKYYSNTYKIPLTKEWLNKFGFKYTEQGWYYIEFDKNYLTININDFKTCLGSKNCIKEAWNIFINECCYVSDLQNLFFALTGTELELKDECSTCG